MLGVVTSSPENDEVALMGVDCINTSLTIITSSSSAMEVFALPTIIQFESEVADNLSPSQGSLERNSSMPGGGSVLSASLPKTGALPFTSFDSRNSLLLLSQRESPQQILAELNQMPFLLENETSSDVQGVGSN